MPLLEQIAELIVIEPTPASSASSLNLKRLGADVIPLYRLNKRQGKQLLAELGADPAIYEKIPTADLEENRPGIADEVALGVTYNDIDDYLEGKTVSSEAKEKIENWWRKTEHKRHLPITVFDDFWK